MPNIARPAPTFPAPTLWLAVGLCVVLAAGRSLSDWAALSSLQLPDTDDVMRLVQIRDWLGGQGFFDLTQYRLGGPGGTPMHWSRLGDIGPAAIMLAARPLLGAQGAELAALILWPSLLFLAFILLSASIAGQLGGTRAVGVGVVLAALAFPATALFAPGRIDHHAVQLVLFLIALRHSIGKASRRSGGMAGIAIATSLAVGVELVVPLAILCGFVCLRWVHDGERTRLSGMSLGLLGGLAVMAILAPANWIYPACDAFTRQAALSALIGAVAMAAMAHAPVMPSQSGRMAAVGGIAIIVLGLIALVAPACLAHPYAGVDPVVRAGWMSRVEEARGLMALSPVEWIGMAGLPLAALIAALFQATRHRGPDWALLTLLVIGSIALALVQARAIHVASALAPAVLAPLVARLRVVRPALAPLGWLLSIGISYPLAARAMPSPNPVSAPGCDAEQAIRALAGHPAGLVLAPIDLGPRLLLDTRHAVLAAPYHRNNRGIRAWIDGADNPA
ncbi:MAG: hypothetical protein ACK4Z4_16425, partial [Ferrovibrio sp.]